MSLPKPVRTGIELSSVCRQGCTFHLAVASVAGADDLTALQNIWGNVVAGRRVVDWRWI